MADLQDTNASEPPGGDQGTVLEVLGALRAQRVAATQTDIPLPDTQDRLWATYKLAGGSTGVMAQVVAGQDGAVVEACAFLARATVTLFLADGASGSPSKPLERKPVNPQPFPGCEDAPLGYVDERLETMFPTLCPPRPFGAHTPASRVRALIGSDPLVEQHTLLVGAWMQGAARRVSEDFAGE